LKKNKIDKSREVEVRVKKWGNCMAEAKLKPQVLSMSTLLSQNIIFNQ